MKVSLTMLSRSGLLLGVLFMVFRPLGLPAAGLDPSWNLILEHAFLNRLRFGSDIVFTFGPLGFAYANLFHPDTFGMVLGVQTVIWLAWSSFLWALPPARAWLCLVALLALCIPVGREFVFLTIPMLGFLVSAKNKRAIALVLWICAGAVANIKFSFAISGVFLAIAADALHITKRRVPTAALATISSFALVFWMVGGDITSIIEYVAKSLSISAGYSEAMALYGPTSELITFVVSAGIFWGVVSVTSPITGTGTGAKIIFSVAFAGYLFLVAKAGFVRHDAHSLIAWTAAAAVGVVLWSYIAERERGHELALGSVVLLLLTCSWFVKHKVLSRSPDGPSLVETATNWPMRQAQSLAAFSSVGYHQQMVERRASQVQSLVHGLDLDAKRTYDVLPWELAALITSKYAYEPRPVPQSYAAYNADLARMNSQHIARNGADSLLLRTGGIDNHWPTLDDGAAYHPVMLHYDPIDLSSLGVEFRRRSQPRTHTNGPKVAQQLVLDQWLPLPPKAAKAVRFATIAFPKSLFTRLKTTLFKPALYHLEAELADGRIVRHRIVPSMTTSKFLLSPYIEGNELINLLQPTFGTSENINDVVAIRLHAAHRTLFDPFDAQLTLYDRIYSGSPEHDSELLRSGALLAELAGSARYDHPIHPRPFNADALLTHADMTLEKKVSDVTSVSFVIGIRDPAWLQGDTDGVVFTLGFEQEGKRIPLLVHDLDPKRRVEDRGDQLLQYDFDRPATGILLFEYQQKSNSRYDWSYLRAIKIESVSPVTTPIAELPIR